MITVVSDADADTASAGEIIFMPKDSSHAIRAGAEGAKMPYGPTPIWQGA